MRSVLATCCMTCCAIFGAALLFEAPAAQSGATPPDFSGVYYPYNPGRGGGGGRQAGAPAGAAPGATQPGAQRGGPPPRPAQSAPLSDGSQGRSADAPKLRPEYLAKWEQMRKSRIARGAIFASSGFSRSAREFAESRPIDLHGRERLQQVLADGTGDGK